MIAFMAALAHGGGESGNGEATDDTNYGDILWPLGGSQQRNKLGAVRIHLRHYGKSRTVSTPETAR